MGPHWQQTPLYNAHSGGCHDGLHAHGVNENQGAESTIVHLLAQLSMYQLAPATVRPRTSRPPGGRGRAHSVTWALATTHTGSNK